MRWVIVAESVDGAVTIIGPGKNRTYPSSEKAGKDADCIETEYEQVRILPIIGITEQ